LAISPRIGLGGRDDVGSARRVVDGLAKSGDFAAQTFAGDEAGGIVGAAIDLQATG